MTEYISITSSTSSPQRGHPRAAWDALLSGDLATAMASESRFLDPATGEPFPDEMQAEIAASIEAGRIAHANQKSPPRPTASATKPRAEGGMSRVSRQFWEKHAQKHGTHMQPKRDDVAISVPPGTDDKLAEIARRIAEGGQ